jgi:hypothetical protein
MGEASARGRLAACLYGRAIAWLVRCREREAASTIQGKQGGARQAGPVLGAIIALAGRAATHRAR